MNAPRVRVYTKDHCPYCVRVKALLGRMGVALDEIDVEGRDDLRTWLVEATGQRTVPQVFVGDRSLGGYRDVAALDEAGQLDRVLRGDDGAPPGPPAAPRDPAGA